MSIFELDIKAKEYLEIVAKISELEALKKSMQEIFQVGIVFLISMIRMMF